MDKKGFLFTVTVFLILTYILLSISVWVKGVEASERAYSEFYKESTVELAIEQITPAKVGNVTNIVMNRALFRLNGQSIDHPLKDGASIGDENAYIRAALSSLLVNGTAPSSSFEDGQGMNDDNSSLAVWVSNLNASLGAIGVYISDFKVSHFNVYQGGIDTVNYSFDMSLKLSDYSNTSAVTRTYPINNSLDISGLVDPALARGSLKLTEDGKHTVYRQFFFNSSRYASPDKISVTQLSPPGQAGQGWVYGYLASASPSNDPLVPYAKDLDTSQWHSYIIVGRFSEIALLGEGVYGAFAGYIVTDAPSYSDVPCTTKTATYPNEIGTFNPIKYSGDKCDVVSIDPGAGASTLKPFIVAPSFNPADAPECPTANVTVHGRCALITNKWLALPDVRNDPLKKLDKSASAIYSVEAMRDFVMCGYYTADPAAPSYFQRLLPDSYSRNNTLGIETFVIGQYANSTSYDLNSRLDRELLNSSIEGVKIMGLPGCKNYESCADTPTTGIFAASQDVISAYGLGPLACSGTRCG